MFDVSKFKTEPTRWQYSYKEGEGETLDMFDMFRYFGFSDVTYFTQGAEHFLIYNEEVFSFYSQKNEAKQITVIMNYIQFFIRREPDYVFFFHGETIIEKTSKEVFIEEKPPFDIFPAWHIFFRVPHGKTEIALRDLPECNLLF